MVQTPLSEDDVHIETLGLGTAPQKTGAGSTRDLALSLLVASISIASVLKEGRMLTILDGVLAPGLGSQRPTSRQPGT
jgi:hypothetical protein